MRVAYCEYADCPVILYVFDEKSNCPGCGRFGRLKDVKDEDE